MFFSVFSSLCLKDRIFTCPNCVEAVTGTDGRQSMGALALTLGLESLVLQAPPADGGSLDSLFFTSIKGEAWEPMITCTSNLC